jgi:hypothetical protein
MESVTAHVPQGQGTFALLDFMMGVTVMTQSYPGPSLPGVWPGRGQGLILVDTIVL